MAPSYMYVMPGVINDKMDDNFDPDMGEKERQTERQTEREREREGKISERGRIQSKS